VSEYLVDLSDDSSNHPMYVMARCPICEEKILDPDEDCGTGKNHPETVETHILQHDPEDLGLDEYRFRPMADILIELHRLGRETEEAL
jgi:hypothetical protein